MSNAITFKKKKKTETISIDLKNNDLKTIKSEKKQSKNSRHSKPSVFPRIAPSSCGVGSKKETSVLHDRVSWPTNLSRVKPTTRNSSLSNNVVRKKTATSARYSRKYTIKPVIPADKKELISVAKAMHREEFGHRVNQLFRPEAKAAVDAIKSGVYIGWRCPEYTWDCIRLSKDSRCFCNHNLSEHDSYDSRSYKVKCLSTICRCKGFEFIPERPEDIGEWWLPKRQGFNVALWRAKCRCKHTHDLHDPFTKKCTVRSCCCFRFESDFLCVACDKHWEEHETFFDGINSRKTKGLPFGPEYLPFSELPDLQTLCLTGKETDDSQYQSIPGCPYGIPEL